MAKRKTIDAAGFKLPTPKREPLSPDAIEAFASRGGTVVSLQAHGTASLQAHETAPRGQSSEGQSAADEPRHPSIPASSQAFKAEGLQAHDATALQAVESAASQHRSPSTPQYHELAGPQSHDVATLQSYEPADSQLSELASSQNRAIAGLQARDAAESPALGSSPPREFATLQSRELDSSTPRELATLQSREAASPPHHELGEGRAAPTASTPVRPPSPVENGALDLSLTRPRSGTGDFPYVRRDGVATRSTSVHLELDLHHRLRLRALEENRSMSSVIADAVRNYLA